MARELVFPEKPIGDIAELGIPFHKRGGLTLVAREYAVACAEKVLEGNYDFLGYEGFTLYEDNRVQPHMEWSASWSREYRPPKKEIFAQLMEPPENVTHYEFYFRAI